MIKCCRNFFFVLLWKNIKTLNGIYENYILLPRAWLENQVSARNLLEKFFLPDQLCLQSERWRSFLFVLGVEIPLANLHFEITRRVFIAEVFNFHSRMLKFLFSTGTSAHCSVLNNFMQIYSFSGISISWASFGSDFGRYGRSWKFNEICGISLFLIGLEMARRCAWSW